MPETREALREFMSLQGPDVENLLTELGRHATRIVPELVGLSLGLAEDGLTFTLLAAPPPLRPWTRCSTSTGVSAWRSRRAGWTPPRST
ncbi:hypothetical protein ISU10_00165 [Nocardioides agariphilus]|uniref:Uncharacterized protein n=1 Tax=Nocardioides agariphilus TaxID=433664 RepID=A0A930VKF5_9ACTN|nr:hypothetical protein [Nocardioides agariphilus]MBF4766177.1 hypothetical protein [Nocardioides agariphilus]